MAEEKLSEAQRKFLTELVSWDGIASPQDLGPQTHQSENSARQTCKRRGYVTFSALLKGEIGEHTTDALVADARSLVEDITQCFHEFNAYRNALLSRIQEAGDAE